MGAARTPHLKEEFRRISGGEIKMISDVFDLIKAAIQDTYMILNTRVWLNFVWWPYFKA